MLLSEFFVKIGVQADTAALKNFERETQNVRMAIAAVGAVAAATAYKLLGITKEMADFGHDVGIMSEKLGIGAETLQELTFAIQQNGGEVGNLQMGLKLLGQTMYAAAKGGKEQVKLFSDLGIAYKDTTTGALRPFEDMIGDLADKFKGMEGGPEKAALAVMLFGRSGLSMIPMLNNGRDGIMALREEAVALGGIMSKDMVDHAKEMKKSLEAVDFATRGLKMRMHETLGPALQTLLDKWVIPAIKAFREWEKETGAIATALKGLGYVLASIGVALSLWTLGAAVGGLVKLIGLITMAGNAAVWATIKMLLGPILIGGAFVALGLVVDDLNHYMEGTDSLLGRLAARHEGIKLLADTLAWVAHYTEIISSGMGYVTSGFTEASKEEVTAALRKKGNFFGYDTRNTFTNAEMDLLRQGATVEDLTKMRETNRAEEEAGNGERGFWQTPNSPDIQKPMQTKSDQIFFPSSWRDVIGKTSTALTPFESVAKNPFNPYEGITKQAMEKKDYFITVPVNITEAPAGMGKQEMVELIVEKVRDGISGTIADLDAQSVPNLGYSEQ